MALATQPAQAPGLLFHHQELNRSGCPRCGWSGAPTYLGGVRQDECPHCEGHTDEFLLELEALRAEPVFGKVGRNEPCPCGSGRKYKKCHGAVV